MVPLGELEMRQVFEFHSKLVLRHLRASSLPMRLWGWEQTEDLIALSYKHRWHAKAYLVRKIDEACGSSADGFLVNSLGLGCVCVDVGLVTD